MPDINWKSYYGDNPDVSEFVNPPDPENCVDAVRGSNYEWNNCAMISGSRDMAQLESKT